MVDRLILAIPPTLLMVPAPYTYYGLLSRLALVLLLLIVAVYGQSEVCQANCVSADRLVGPTRMSQTRDYPYDVASFPSASSAFCKLGCQMFFSEVPNNFTCKNSCEYAYRYQLTTGYSDVANEAILECKDGCDIALLVCQQGFYCTQGQMTECSAGRYREPVNLDLSIVSLSSTSECTDCPFGRYRTITRGRNADDCVKCPIGKYANITGSISVTDCQRCPAGMTAEEPGMRLCKCITETKNQDGSCDFFVQGVGQPSQSFYKNKVDYYRETIPYIGRF